MGTTHWGSLEVGMGCSADDIRIEYVQMRMLQSLFAKDGMTGFAEALRRRADELEPLLHQAPPGDQPIILYGDDETIFDPSYNPS